MIQWLINLFRPADPELEIQGVPRSTRWPTVRKKFLESHPTCAACGGSDKLNVHHCTPYHLDASKELDLENLVTLCEKHGCHLLIGHLASFFSYNATVREDAAALLKKIQTRP